MGVPVVGPKKGLKWEPLTFRLYQTTSDDVPDDVLSSVDWFFYVQNMYGFPRSRIRQLGKCTNPLRGSCGKEYRCSRPDHPLLFYLNPSGVLPSMLEMMIIDQPDLSSKFPPSCFEVTNKPKLCSRLCIGAGTDASLTYTTRDDTTTV